MKLITIIGLLLFIIPIASAATIQGHIYDYSLNDMNNVIVTVDSDPVQKYISKDGYYAFELEPGQYTLKADYSEENILVYQTQENLTINGQGTYTLDLILIPSFEEDPALYEDLELDFPEEDQPKSKGVVWLFFLAMIVFCILVLVYVFDWRYRIKSRPEQANFEEDEHLSQLITIIKDNKRITQKDLRKQIPVSEAKISLMIADLESQGKIKKIKKGRGNIIVWI
jgi:uncharacterized membrane protein